MKCIVSKRFVKNRVLPDFFFKACVKRFMSIYYSKDMSCLFIYFCLF